MKEVYEKVVRGLIPRMSIVKGKSGRGLIPLLPASVQLSLQLVAAILAARDEVEPGSSDPALLHRYH